MPDLARATAGQLRRAGFVILPDDTPDNATSGFEVVTGQGDEQSRAEHAAAVKRGDAFPDA